MPRARGSANQIHKKTCHIDLVLAQNGEKVGMPTKNDFKIKEIVKTEKIQKKEKLEEIKEKKEEKIAKLREKPAQKEVPARKTAKK